jgi:hypothetical protein
MNPTRRSPCTYLPIKKKGENLVTFLPLNRWFSRRPWCVRKSIMCRSNKYIIYLYIATYTECLIVFPSIKLWMMSFYATLIYIHAYLYFPFERLYLVFICADVVYHAPRNVKGWYLYTYIIYIYLYFLMRHVEYVK